jgi:hypothetical protein
VNWLVKTNSKQFEVWTESEYQNRLMKCEYYGARPFWQKAMRLAPPQPGGEIRYNLGEIIPYKRSSIGKRFAVIVELFSHAGKQMFTGIDIETKRKIVSTIV